MTLYFKSTPEFEMNQHRGNKQDEELQCKEVKLKLIEIQINCYTCNGNF